MDWVVPEYGLGSRIGFEEMEAIARGLQQDGLGGGALLREFELAFARFCGAQHCIATVSGTTALHMVAHALDLGGDTEVICTPQTFQATMLPFLYRRVPVRFCDIEADTLCPDPATVERLITPRTRALYVMHYGGLPCDMDPFLQIAARRGLVVVEDAAHAPGALYHDRRIGGLSHATCFSFGSLKNMTLLGQGGAITTNDDALAARLSTMVGRGLHGERRQRPDRMIGPYREPDPRYADHSGDSYSHDWVSIDAIGANLSPCSVQAAAGLVQLAKLDHMNEIRRSLVARYRQGLGQIEGMRFQAEHPGRQSVYHLFPVFFDQKETGIDHDDLIRAIEARGVRVNNRFFPCHLSSYLRPLGHQFGDCPVTERVWFDQQVNLPISPLHTTEQVDYAVEAIAEAVRSLRK